MADKILSPDGKQEWNGTEWVPLSDIAPTSKFGTDEKTSAIVNYAELCLDSLSRGDPTGAKTYYDKALEVDFKIGKRIFEGEYAIQIAEAYYILAINQSSRVIQTRISREFTSSGGYTFASTNGYVESEFAFDIFIISVNNCTSFMKARIDELDSASDEEIILRYKLSLLLNSTSSNVLKGMNLAYVHADGVEYNYMQKYRIKLAENCDYGSGMRALVEISLENRSIDLTDNEEVNDLMKMVERGRGPTENLIELMEEKNKATNSCFIATAAYGTPYDSKIDVLRNWRDDSLKSSSMGRMFIRNYYFFSPPIASIVAKSAILRGIVRLILSPIIHLLKTKYSRLRKSRS